MSEPKTAEVKGRDRAVSAHYGDPCLYCGSPIEDVAVGSCPERKGNEPGQRIEYHMSSDDLGGIMSAIATARATPLVALNAGMPEGPQAAANRAWCELGKRLGFDGMSVEPSPKGDRFFTAVASEAGQ